MHSLMDRDYARKKYAASEPFLIWTYSNYSGAKSCGRLGLGKYGHQVNILDKWGGVKSTKTAYTHNTAKKVYRALKSLMDFGMLEVSMWLEPLDAKEAEEFRLVFPFAKELAKDEEPI